MSLDAAQRQSLAALARVMIPGWPAPPGAEALALHEGPATHVLAIDPTRLEPLARFLAGAGEVGTLAEVETLARADPEGFEALSVVLANAYFMHPDTRAAIGYPGQEARDSSVGLSEADLALVARVSARGPIWRKA